MEEEKEIKDNPGDLKVLREAKKVGFSDKVIAQFWNLPETEIFALRKANGMIPVYKMIDTCASEFESYIPYFYSTYEDRKSVV